jgi:fructokinase
MKKVFCFGEVLIDFINTGTISDGVQALNTFTQYPGGAPANAAVAVSKLGGNAYFIGQVGNDPFGHFLIDALNIYGVNTELTAIHPQAKTALAFVFLDENGERSFAFHRENTADLVFNKNQIKKEWFTADTIVHFCSNTLTDDLIAQTTQHLITSAHNKNALISFDVNLRHNLWRGDAASINLVNHFVQQAHMVKFAREELDYLSGGTGNSSHEPYIKSCFDAGVKVILITDGGNDVVIALPSEQVSIAPPLVTAIDTTGGGDAFIGAVLFGLSQHSTPLKMLEQLPLLKPLIAFAIHCGAITVTKHGAFPALPTFEDVKQHWSVLL